MIFELILKIQRNPIIDFLADELTPISEISFPAISYCPEVKTVIGDFDYGKIVDAIKDNEIQISDLSDEKLNLMHAIGLIMNDDFLLQFNLSLSTENISDSFAKVLRITEDEYKGSFIQKYQLNFAKLLTPFGFCLTFNNMDASDLFHINKIADIFKFERTLEIYEYNSGVKAVSCNDSYPLKTPNFQLGFHGIFGRKLVEENYTTHFGDIIDGQHFIVHKNDEIPMKSSNRFYSAINETTVFIIDPHLKTIDEDLYSTSLEERNCYLNGEKVLKFFKVYSKNNCGQECLSEETLKACGCVQFFMIRDNKTTICGINDKVCYEKIESNFKALESKCKCIPSCNILNYDIEMKRLSFEGSERMFTGTFNVDKHPSEVTFLFKENEVFTFIRKKQFTTVDFLSDCGGILGLFAGISVLSIVEVVYYFSLRILVNAWIDRKKSKIIPVKPIHTLDDQLQTNNNNTQSILRMFLNYTKFVLQESSIHGCNYIVNPLKSWIERVSDDFIYDINIILKNSNQNSTNAMNLKNPLSTSAKIHDGLTMNIKRNNSILKSEICLGYGFIVHGSDESPYKFESTSVLEYAFKTSMEVVITPVVIYSEENLRKFSPEKRHCYFADEKKLRFYKKYTMNNCEIECLSNYTLKTCHCIPFDSIRDKNATVCGINSIYCSRRADYDVKYDPSSQIFTECDCLPDCTSVKYNVEYIRSKFNPNFKT
ncbi:unnamed protein product [Diamesa serratosioi]